MKHNVIDGICIPPYLVADIWPSVGPLIERAIVRGGINEFEDTEKEIHAGRMIMWAAWDGTRVLAVAVTQIAMIGGVKYGTIVALGGKELDRYAHLIEQLHGYFREHGCQRTRIIGRPGWARLLPEYKVKSVVIEKVL